MPTGTVAIRRRRGNAKLWPLTDLLPCRSWPVSGMAVIVSVPALVAVQREGRPCPGDPVVTEAGASVLPVRRSG